jgi:hypothetical protein
VKTLLRFVVRVVPAVSLAAIAAGLASPVSWASGSGAVDVIDSGRGPCAIAGDYDWGWCYAKYGGIADPADCEFDDASEEFIEGCKAFTGEDESGE